MIRGRGEGWLRKLLGDIELKNKLSFFCFLLTSHNIQLIHHYHIAHNAPCLSLKILHKHCFSLEDCNTQEKLEAMVMVNKVYYGHCERALSTPMRFQKYVFSLSSETHQSIRVHTNVLMRFRLSTPKRSRKIELRVVT